MIKLLNYKQTDNKLTLNFEKQQFIYFYPFAGGIYTTTSDGITKLAVEEIKQKLTKDWEADLSSFINTSFKEYGE